ncbi:MAG: hypothetical protein HC930_08325 [Hydrococcus sp. SU_1_0]|nr:hypothetical protein [Hydrococcus sp. SU_1_0]
MKAHAFYMLLSYCAKTGLIILVYIVACLAVNKTIFNRIVNSVVIGLFTPFFVYQFMINFIHPVSYILYFTKIYDPSIAILIVSILAKSLSIVIGIIVTIFLLMKEHLLESLKEDIFNTLNSKSNNKSSKK